MPQSVEKVSGPSRQWISLCGVALLWVTAAAATLLGQLWPLISSSDRWSAADLVAHLLVLGLLLVFTALGGGWLLGLGGWLNRPDSAPARRAVDRVSWLLRGLTALVPLGIIVTQLMGVGDPYGPAHALLPGTFAVMAIALTVVLLLPLTALIWMLTTRQQRWMADVARFMQGEGQGGQLQGRFRQLHLPLRAFIALLLGAAIFLLPVLLVDRAPAIAIQTPLQRLLIEQQVPLTQLTFLSSLAMGAGLWLWRSAAQDLTHTLDPQHSRIAALWRQPQELS